MSLWFKLGGVAIAAFAVWLGLTMFGNSRYHAGELTERAKWQAVVAKGKDEQLAEYQRGVEKGQQAAAVYHQTTERIIQPTLTKIIERSTQYAATPAGAAQCLSADRVRMLDDARASLFPAANPGAAGGGSGSVPANGAGG